MLISIVMLLFSDQISGRGKSFQVGGGKLAQGGTPLPPRGKKPVLLKIVVAQHNAKFMTSAPVEL